jgi:molybdopterin synthase catalytic subunit
MRSEVPGTITVRLFARYAEIVGREVVTLSLPGPATVADVVHRVRAELPGAIDLPERPLAAVNLRQVGLNEQVVEGDEVALLPPLAGG